jgi:RNA polymerase sigma-70 factor (ECF subfamily)
LLYRVRNPDDTEAWENFVGRYAPAIFLWCRQNSLQESDAADVTQEVLCKLIDVMQRFDYDASRGRFRGWLKTVTTNAVRDLIRGRQRTGKVAGRGDDGWLAALADPQSTDLLADAIEVAYREELVSMAEERVRVRVQPRIWQAYVLTAIEQKPAAEVAKDLEIKVSDVYVAKSRVIKLLREEVARLTSH